MNQTALLLEPLRKQLVEVGHENNKRYSPDRVAVELNALYSNTLD